MRALFGVLLCLLALARSFAAGDFTGSWEIDTGDPAQTGRASVVTYGPGKKVKHVFEELAQASKGGTVLRVTVTGTYTYKGDQLKHVYTAIDIMMPDGDASANRSLRQAAKENQKTALKSLNDLATYRIHWVDKDTFEASDKSGFMATYRRGGSRPRVVPAFTDDVPYAGQPGFAESKFFILVAFGVGALIVLVLLLRKPTRPQAPPRLY